MKAKEKAFCIRFLPKKTIKNNKISENLKTILHFFNFYYKANNNHHQ